MAKIASAINVPFGRWRSYDGILPQPIRKAASDFGSYPIVSAIDINLPPRALNHSHTHPPCRHCPGRRRRVVGGWAAAVRQRTRSQAAAYLGVAAYCLGVGGSASVDALASHGVWWVMACC